MAPEDPGQKLIVTNRRARHDFFILESYEAGIALRGTEVKALREGKANLKDGYAMVRRGELWLVGMHVSPFDKGNINNHDPLRDRKLLMHRKEIRKLIARLGDTGLTLVPLRLYFRRNIVKVELGLAQGKKSFDKRETIKKREVERQLRREFSR